MAISTPAQKPRGEASSTRSTSIDRHRPASRAGRSAVAWCAMSAPRVVAVAPGSPAARAGLEVGDEVLSLNGQVPRDVIEWRLLADEAEVELEVRRGGRQHPGRAWPSGRASRSAPRCRRRCSTGCARATTTASSASSTSCRQGLRPSLYLKDDDYRLSFLYGNFTTLTRFTEADLERVITEGLSPLQRQHPRHRPRGARRACCATGGAPPACAGCGPCSTTASRCTARSWCARA